MSFKTSYLCWIIISYYAKVHCLQKNIMCQLIIKIKAFHCAFWRIPENLLVHCYCSVVVEFSLRCRSELTNQKLWNLSHASQSEALKPEPLWVLSPSPTPNLPSLHIFLTEALSYTTFLWLLNLCSDESEHHDALLPLKSFKPLHLSHVTI